MKYGAAGARRGEKVCTCMNRGFLTFKGIYFHAYGGGELVKGIYFHVKLRFPA